MIYTKLQWHEVLQYLHCKVIPYYCWWSNDFGEPAKTQYDVEIVQGQTNNKCVLNC